MGEEYGIEYQIAEAIYDGVMSIISEVIEDIKMPVEANFDLLRLEQQAPYFEMADRIIDILEDNPEELSMLFDV